MADDEKLVDPLLEPSDSDSDLDLEDNLAPPPTDSLDLEVVDEFDVADFDEDFDDDFEEGLRANTICRTISTERTLRRSSAILPILKKPPLAKRKRQRKQKSLESQKSRRRKKANVEVCLSFGAA